MLRMLTLAVLIAAVASWNAVAVVPRGGAPRPQPGRTPSFNGGGGARPTAPRPNPGGARPGMVPQARPQQPMQRPNIQQPVARPQPIQRPTAPQRPVQRPAPQPIQRPSPQPIQRPTPQPGRPNFPSNPGMTRPTPPTTRPGIVPGGRPSVQPPQVRPPITTLPGTTRPNLPDRPQVTPPAIRPPVTTLPGNRPDGGNNWNNNRPDWNGNRPNWNGNRPDWNHNRPGWNNNRPDININNNNNYVNNNINHWNNTHNNWNRPTYPNRPWYPDYHWHSNNWNWGYRPPYWGVGTAGFMLGTNYTFINPYYVAPLQQTVVYNYAEPLPPIVIEQQPSTTYVNVEPAPVAVPGIPEAPATTSDQPVDSAKVEDPKTKEALAKFDAARDSFKAGNYDQAMTGIDQAIQLLPSDAQLHEFRALVLFAQGKYRDAAGVLYAVLASGPGWDWETLKSLYPNLATYEKQIAALQDYNAKNPQAADGRFVLAYHCLVLDERPSAIALLQRVVELNPQDKLSADILAALKQPQGDGGPKPKIAPTP